MHNISIKNLTKSYNKARILRGISLDINAGEFVTLLGSSGCGKTTLLNILGGFSSFDSGEISIDSKVYTHMLNLSPTRIKVFQNYVLLPWKNALNQVIFALKSSLNSANIKKSKGEIKDIALNYLELVGLKEHIYKFPHELSGGQQSRVSIARALSVQPEVLLMDEPFGALDSFTRENLQNELKMIVKTLKTTCIFVTHDVIESMILGSKIVVMNNAEGNIALQITQNREYNKQDSYFNNLQEEIYEALKYPQAHSQEKYVI